MLKNKIVEKKRCRKLNSRQTQISRIRKYKKNLKINSQQKMLKPKLFLKKQDK